MIAQSQGGINRSSIAKIVILTTGKFGQKGDDENDGTVMSQWKKITLRQQYLYHEIINIPCTTWCCDDSSRKAKANQE